MVGLSNWCGCRVVKLITEFYIKAKWERLDSFSPLSNVAIIGRRHCGCRPAATHKVMRPPFAYKQPGVGVQNRIIIIIGTPSTKDERKNRYCCELTIEFCQDFCSVSLLDLGPREISRCCTQLTKHLKHPILIKYSFSRENSTLQMQSQALSIFSDIKILLKSWFKSNQIFFLIFQLLIIPDHFGTSLLLDGRRQKGQKIFHIPRQGSGLFAIAQQKFLCSDRQQNAEDNVLRLDN